MKKLGEFLFRNSKAVQGGLTNASKPAPQAPQPQ